MRNRSLNSDRDWKNYWALKLPLLSHLKSNWYHALNNRAFIATPLKAFKLHLSRTECIIYRIWMLFHCKVREIVWNIGGFLPPPFNMVWFRSTTFLRLRTGSLLPLSDFQASLPIKLNQFRIRKISIWFLQHVFVPTDQINKPNKL